MNQNFFSSEFFKKLPEETKEKLMNCKSEEEAMDILKADMVEIPDEMLDSVGGGRSYNCSQETTCPMWCRGDSREKVSFGQMSIAFSEGCITGEEFF
jgi:hypothetical protein